MINLFIDFDYRAICMVSRVHNVVNMNQKVSNKFCMFENCLFFTNFELLLT